MYAMTFKAPEHTTTNNARFTPDTYAMGFAPELIQFILSEQKLSSYRYGTKYSYLKVGDKVDIQDSSTSEVAGKAKITAISSKQFKDISLSTGTHENYKDKEHQRRVLSGYYSFIGRPVADDDVFTVFDFVLVK